MTRVKTECGCEWTFDGTPICFGLWHLIVWKVQSCRQGPSKAGVCLSYKSAHRRVAKAAKELNCHEFMLPFRERD